LPHRLTPVFGVSRQNWRQNLKKYRWSGKISRKVHVFGKKPIDKRCAAGVVIAPVPIDISTLDLLIHLGWLAERDAGDRRKIGLAAAQALHRAVVAREAG
jgi:hypothetical protein